MRNARTSRRAAALVLTVLTVVAFAPAARAASASAFSITLNYTGAFTTAQTAAFESARSTWMRIITGYVPSDSLLTGITIDASAPYIDGAYNILGQAGPTQGRSSGGYLFATRGEMEFDSADLGRMETEGSLTGVITHEMGHVLGLGTLWTHNRVYSSAVPGRYTGAYALAEYRSEFSRPDAAFIPVEQGGGAGTAGGHWDEIDNGRESTGVTDRHGRDMRNELMTGWLNSPTWISRTTAASFQDLGYTMNFAALDVPEPSSLALAAGLGLPLMAVRLRRRSTRPTDVLATDSRSTG